MRQGRFRLASRDHARALMPHAERAADLETLMAKEQEDGYADIEAHVSEIQEDMEDNTDQELMSRSPKLEKYNQDNFGKSSATPSEGGRKLPRSMPEAKISMWIQETEGYQASKREYNELLADAYLHPVMALKLYSCLTSVYNIFRHGLRDNPEVYQVIDGRLITISHIARQISFVIIRSGGDDSSIILDPQSNEAYYKFLNYVEDTWSEIQSIIGRLGLGVQFHKIESWIEKTQGARGELSKRISDKEAREEERINKLVQKRLDRILIDKGLKKPESDAKKEEVSPLQTPPAERVAIDPAEKFRKIEKLDEEEEPTEDEGGEENV